MADPVPAVKIAIKEVIDRSHLSRAQIVDAVNRLAALGGIKRRLKENVLNKWTAESDTEHPIHLELLKLFCLAMNDYWPLTVYAGGFPGAHIINEDEWQVLLWAKKEIKLREDRKEVKRMAQRIGI